MNAKYVNGLPLYPTSQEFLRNDIHISKQVMANWMIQCADRYLGILYDFLHKELYRYHVLQADEAPVMVSKDGRPANSNWKPCVTPKSIEQHLSNRTFTVHIL